MPNPCLVCGDPASVARGRCGTCYQFARRNGTDRPFALIAALTQRDIEREWTGNTMNTGTHFTYVDNGPCRNCGWRIALQIGGRCSTCDGYLKRTGNERPPAIILRHMRRLFEGDKYVKSSEIKNQFMDKVDLVSERPCWRWAGSRNPAGYGLMRIDGGLVGAHRLSYMLYVGPISPDLVIDHLCRNKGCVNPEHLDLVTQSENMRRAG